MRRLFRGSAESVPLVHAIAFDVGTTIMTSDSTSGQSMITLQIIDGHERGRVYSDLAAPVSLGREEDNVIRLNDERVSRFHAKIQVDQDRVILTDLESTNGTRVNGHPIKMRILQEGDQISIGRSILLYGGDSELEGTVYAEADGPTANGFDPDASSEIRGELFPAGPPKLPTELTPGQRAELSDLLTYMHQQLMSVSLVSYTGENEAESENGPHIVVPKPGWRQFTKLQATLASYLNDVTDA